MNNNNIIKPEDYNEPRCILCAKPEGTAPQSVPQQRIAEKLDEYLSKKDYAGAERHLKYWYTEALQNGDIRGQLAISNEMMGFYRKAENEEEAIRSAERAIKLTEQLNLTETISGGTTYLNAGTVMSAFNKTDYAVTLFEKTKHIYLKVLNPDDSRFGGLYNNMAVALAAKKRFGEAYECFTKALDIMKQSENGEAEQAITYLNMANAAEAEHGLIKAEKKIDQYLEKAEQLLDNITIKNGYYAFVCEKCAPTFDYYGWFMTAQKLYKEASDIYDRT